MIEYISVPRGTHIIPSGQTGIVWATGPGGITLDENGVTVSAYGAHNGKLAWYMDFDNGRIYACAGATESVAAAVARVYCHYCGVGQTPADPAVCKCCGAALPRSSE